MLVSPCYYSGLLPCLLICPLCVHPSKRPKMECPWEISHSAVRRGSTVRNRRRPPSCPKGEVRAAGQADPPDPSRLGKLVSRWGLLSVSVSLPLPRHFDYLLSVPAGLAGRSQKFQVAGAVQESVSFPVTVGPLALAETCLLFRVRPQTTRKRLTLKKKSH